MSRPAKLGALVAVAMGLGQAVVEAGTYDRLLNVTVEDSSYKVRMKAIRVIAKRITKSGKPAPERVFDVLGTAAQTDESYLVRGMACVALGQIGDLRATPFLQAAKADEEAFVRAQAESALERLKPAPRPGDRGNLIVVGADRPTATELPDGLQDELLAALEAELADLARGYRVARQGQDKGFHLIGTIARLDVTDAEGGQIRLTLEVKLTVATWPENNLRHVMSAKASAKMSKTRDRRKVQKQLLRAAVRRTVSDALEEIGGGIEG